MKIKYFGTSWEKGLTLTASLFTTEGAPVHEGFPMVETGVNTSIYITANILETVTPLSPGVYVTRITDSEGVFLGYDEVIFNGLKSISLLDIRLMTDKELMQLRDSLGIDGDKMVARDGQLQKKSEYPYNEIIDTTNI